MFVYIYINTIDKVFINPWICYYFLGLKFYKIGILRLKRFLFKTVCTFYYMNPRTTLEIQYFPNYKELVGKEKCPSSNQYHIASLPPPPPLQPCGSSVVLY